MYVSHPKVKWCYRNSDYGSWDVLLWGCSWYCIFYSHFPGRWFI